MDIVWTIVGALFAGIIIGPLARLVLPGKQDISLGLTILLGAAGALIGALIYQLLGGSETSGFDWIQWIVEIAAAAVVIFIYLSVRGRQASS